MRDYRSNESAKNSVHSNSMEIEKSNSIHDTQMAKTTKNPYRSIKIIKVNDGKDKRNTNKQAQPKDSIRHSDIVIEGGEDQKREAFNANEEDLKQFPRIDPEIEVDENEFPEGPVFPPGVESKTPMISKPPHIKSYTYTHGYFFRDIINSLVIIWSAVFIFASYILAYDKRGKELYGLNEPNTEYSMSLLEVSDEAELETIFKDAALKTEYLGWFEAAHRNGGEFYYGYDIFMEMMCIGTIFGLYWICLGVYDVVKYNYNARQRASFVFLFESM